MEYNKDKLKQTLTPIQYWVTQQKGTEKPFENEFYKFEQEGLYVDVVSLEPLFLSMDKFQHPCGWPCFFKPVNQLTIKMDYSDYDNPKKELSSKYGKSHLGYLYDDGPKEHGGMRYCINSAALKFIPYARLKEEGYTTYMHYFSKERDK